jgi:uncharacterized Zn-binding protein involved in type VI secretion
MMSLIRIGDDTNHGGKVETGIKYDAFRRLLCRKGLHAFGM